MTTLIVCKSTHHQNPRKIVHVLSEALATHAQLPEELDVDEFLRCDLPGIGRGIYAGRHHEVLLELAGNLPAVAGKPAFIFSTSTIVTKKKTAKDHEALRELLEVKGYRIVGEFSCPGFNTSSFMRYFGGMNRSRPNAQDLEHALDSASDLNRQALTPQSSVSECTGGLPWTRRIRNLRRRAADASFVFRIEVRVR